MCKCRLFFSILILKSITCDIEILFLTNKDLQYINCRRVAKRGKAGKIISVVTIFSFLGVIDLNFRQKKRIFKFVSKYFAEDNYQETTLNQLCELKAEKVLLKVPEEGLDHLPSGMK